MEQRYMEILLEEIRGKFDLVLEGHESLRSEIRELARRNDERFDLLEFKFDALKTRLDSVATDLADHRRDTERHSGYRVSE